MQKLLKWGMSICALALLASCGGGTPENSSVVSENPSSEAASTPASETPSTPASETPSTPASETPSTPASEGPSSENPSGDPGTKDPGSNPDQSEGGDTTKDGSKSGMDVSKAETSEWSIHIEGDGYEMTWALTVDEEGQGVTTQDLSVGDVVSFVRGEEGSEETWGFSRTEEGCRTPAGLIDFQGKIGITLEGSYDFYVKTESIWVEYHEKADTSITWQLMPVNVNMPPIDLEPNPGNASEVMATGFTLPKNTELYVVSSNNTVYDWDDLKDCKTACGLVEVETLGYFKTTLDETSYNIYVNVASEAPADGRIWMEVATPVA